MVGFTLVALMEMLFMGVIIIVVAGQGGGLRAGFYSSSCPKAESIVRSTVQTHYNKDPTLAPALLRLHFHDCFVQVYSSTFLSFNSSCVPHR